MIAPRTKATTSAPVARLHRNTASTYRMEVGEWEQALNGPEIRVVPTPDAQAPDGLRAELEGDLAEILALGERSAGGAGRKPLGKAKPLGTYVLGSQLSVVAGTRFHLCRTSLRWPLGLGCKPAQHLKIGLKARQVGHLGNHL